MASPDSPMDDSPSFVTPEQVGQVMGGIHSLSLPVCLDQDTFHSIRPNVVDPAANKHNVLSALNDAALFTVATKFRLGQLTARRWMPRIFSPHLFHVLTPSEGETVLTLAQQQAGINDAGLRLESAEFENPIIVTEIDTTREQLEDQLSATPSVELQLGTMRPDREFLSPPRLRVLEQCQTVYDQIVAGLNEYIQLALGSSGSRQIFEFYANQAEAPSREYVDVYLYVINTFSTIHRMLQNTEARLIQEELTDQQLWKKTWGKPNGASIEAHALKQSHFDELESIRVTLERGMHNMRRR